MTFYEESQPFKTAKKFPPPLPPLPPPNKSHANLNGIVFISKTTEFFTTSMLQCVILWSIRKASQSPMRATSYIHRIKILLQRHSVKSRTSCAHCALPPTLIDQKIIAKLYSLRVFN